MLRGLLWADLGPAYVIKLVEMLEHIGLACIELSHTWHESLWRGDSTLSKTPLHPPNVHLEARYTAFGSKSASMKCDNTGICVLHGFTAMAAPDPKIVGIHLQEVRNHCS